MRGCFDVKTPLLHNKSNSRTIYQPIIKPSMTAAESRMGRRRLKRSALLAFCALTFCCSAMPATTEAFIPFTAVSRTSSSSAAAVFMTTGSPALSTRLTLEEEANLLRQSAELKRLVTLARELPPSSLSLVKSKHAGYGNDISAYELALDLGHVARDTLVTRNMGLVYYCAKDVGRSLNSLSKDDLVQEGAIGLARAVDKFNPYLGTKFSTYAVYWIRAAMFRCIAERDDMLRVPSHVGDAVRKMTQAAKRLGVEVDGTRVLNAWTESSREALWKEASAAKALAEEAGLSDKQLMEAMKVRQRRLTGGYVSYESWMQKGQSMQVDLETVATAATASPDKEKMKLALARYLRPKEIEALSWRYGLTEAPRDYLKQAEQHIFGEDAITKGKWGEAMSFTEVGKQMKCSAEYGRKLCNKALEKLRQAADQGTLEPAFLF